MCYNRFYSLIWGLVQNEIKHSYEEWASTKRPNGVWVFFKLPIFEFLFPHASRILWADFCISKPSPSVQDFVWNVQYYASWKRNNEKRSERRSFLTKVELRPNESQQQLFRRFRKKVAVSGKLSAVRRKRWFVSKSELRRIAKKKAIRKQKRRQRNRRHRRY